MKDILKRFDKATKDMVIIFPKAFVKDAKERGFGTTIDLNYLKDNGIAKKAIRDFIEMAYLQGRLSGMEEIQKLQKEKHE